MTAKKFCPVCGGPMVASGLVDGLGLIFMCDDDACASHSPEHDCPACGHPTAWVWVGEAGDGEDAGHWERRCFDPLCAGS